MYTMFELLKEWRGQSEGQIKVPELDSKLVVHSSINNEAQVKATFLTVWSREKWNKLNGIET